MEKVTVIIPIFGTVSAKMAIVSAASVLRHYNKSAPKIILSNNGSCPDVKAMIFETAFFDKIIYKEFYPTLSMPEHFEALSQNISTEYFMILPARRILIKGALNKFVEVLDANLDCSACCSTYYEWDDETSCLFVNPASPDTISKSETIINRIKNENLKSRRQFWSSIPTSLNGLVRTKTVNEFRAKFSSPFYDELTPDLSAAFAILLISPKIYLIGSAQFITTGRKFSTGNRAVYNFNGDYFRSLKQKGQLHFLPEQMKASVFASILEDMLRRENLVNPNVSFEITSCMSNFMAKTILLEYCLKLLNSRPSISNFVTFLRTYKILKTRTNGIFSLFRALIIAMLATIYLKTPPFLRRYVNRLRGKVLYLENIHQAVDNENNA